MKARQKSAPGQHDASFAHKTAERLGSVPAEHRYNLRLIDETKCENTVAIYEEDSRHGTSKIIEPSDQ